MIITQTILSNLFVSIVFQLYIYIYFFYIFNKRSFFLSAGGINKTSSQKLCIIYVNKRYHSSIWLVIYWNVPFLCVLKKNEKNVSYIQKNHEMRNHELEFKQKYSNNIKIKIKSLSVKGAVEEAPYFSFLSLTWTSRMHELTDTLDSCSLMLLEKEAYLFHNKINL